MIINFYENTAIMITALIQIKLQQPITQERAREIYLDTAQKYRDIEGLIRKYYVLAEDGGTAGGIYLWNSRDDAEQFYSDDWKKFVFDKYGTHPLITYFYSPVVVDNSLGEIISDA